jgi:hypothetical protein
MDIPRWCMNAADQVSRAQCCRGVDPPQRKPGASQGKMGRFTEMVFGSAIGIKAALWTGQIFYNRTIFL